LTDISALKG